MTRVDLYYSEEHRAALNWTLNLLIGLEGGGRRRRAGVVVHHLFILNLTERTRRVSLVCLFSPKSTLPRYLHKLFRGLGLTKIKIINLLS